MSTNASDAANTERTRQTTRDEAPKPRNNDERIRDLVNALGDPNHPLHSTAINDLVALGPQAVSALGAALGPNRPWLTSYRAAEALAQIGDGGASGALMGALRHPNSNVRWSAIRALAEVGDTRALWALRRVAQEDRGKTSWGESVADTAQLALDRLQSRSALLRFTEPIKTALVFVAMLGALIFAANRVQSVLAELRRNVPAPQVAASNAATSPTSSDAGAAADVTPSAIVTTTATAAPSATAGLSATPTTPEIVTTVTTSASSAKVRSGPSPNAPQIGSVAKGDELIILAQSGQWYRVKLGAKRSVGTIINGTGEGWIYNQLVNRPAQPVPTAKP